MPQVSLALDSRPTDKLIAGETLPGRGPKKQACQVTPETVGDQIMQLAQWVGIAQIMMLREVVDQSPSIRISGRQQSHAQGLQDPQGQTDGLRAGRLAAQGYAHATQAASFLAGRQPDQTLRFQPIEQQSAGHISELAAGIAPIPKLGQGHRESAATPAPTLINPSLEPLEILALEPATKHANRANHVPDLERKQILETSFFFKNL